MTFKTILFSSVILVLIFQGCKKTTSKSETIKISVSSTQLSTGDTLTIGYQLEAKNAGYLWYNITYSLNSSSYKTGTKYINGAGQYTEYFDPVSMNAQGRFDVQAFFGNSTSSARVSSDKINVTVTGTTQNVVNIISPVDSEIYCVNKSIGFKAKTEPYSTDWITWDDNSIYLGYTQSEEIDWFTLNSTGIHDIKAEWTTKGVSKHVGIYVGNPFTFEYDHQVSFDIFPRGRGVVDNAFKYGFTCIDIKYDADTLLDNCIPYEEITDYFRTHVQNDGHGNTLYPGYLCGIQAFLDPAGYVIDTLVGVGSYKNWAFVCVQIADFNNSLNAVAIHELGHHRAKLPDVCLDNGSMNPFHTDSACVMGTFPVSLCTGKDIVTNPHFCPACCDSLKKITW